MSQPQGPILSYLFLTKDIRVLRWILIVGGIFSLLLGMLIGGKETALEFPHPVFWIVGGSSILIGLLSTVSLHVQKHMFDYTFLVFVVVYLAIIFFSFLNHLHPALVPLLIAVQILFAIAFRNFFEYLIFAFSSILLFGITSFSIPDLEILPALFFVLIVLVTLFTGAYVWSRERFLSKVNHSNRMLGDLLDNSTYGIFLLDLTSHEILYHNKVAEVISKRILGHLPADEAALFGLIGEDANEVHNRFLTGTPNPQTRYLHTAENPSGTQIELAFFMSKIRTLQNDSLLIKIQDISEEKRVESALKSSEENYREIFNAGNSGIFIMEPETLLVQDVNKILCKMLGYSYEELLALPIEQVVEKGSKVQLKAFLDRTKEGQTNQQEWLFITKEGHPLHVELSANLAVLGGEFRLMLIVSDIQERIEKRTALLASEQKYRTLVEKMDEGLVMTDTEERILFVNQRICEIIGMEEEELLGQYSYEVFGDVSPEGLIQSKVALRKEGISDQYELQVKKKNGDLLWLSITGSPYVKPPNDIVGAIAIITDITDRKFTELKLQEKNSELDAFVYKASHDLKGPLASIMGVTNIARIEVSDPKAHEYLNLISKSTKRLDLILSELIDVTRINKGALNLEEVDVAQLISEIIQSLSHLPSAQHVSVIQKMHIDAPIISDKKLLTSILQNLIVNGINYHDPKKAEPKVEINVWQNGTKVLFDIVDNGLGIPDRMKHKVFEMFYRGNTQSQGSGLGLYIVKSAIGKLEGSIKLDTVEGEGTCFSVSLPIRTTQAIG